MAGPRVSCSWRGDTRAAPSGSRGQVLASKALRPGWVLSAQGGHCTCFLLPPLSPISGTMVPTAGSGPRLSLIFPPLLPCPSGTHCPSFWIRARRFAEPRVAGRCTQARTLPPFQERAGPASGGNLLSACRGMRNHGGSRREPIITFPPIIKTCIIVGCLQKFRARG